METGSTRANERQVDLVSCKGNGNILTSWEALSEERFDLFDGIAELSITGQQAERDKKGPMKARHCNITHPFTIQHSFAAGLAATVLLCCCGCSTPKPIGVSQTSAPGEASPIQLEPGPIVLVCSSHPASFSFDRDSGQISSAKDRAAEAAKLWLEPPSSGDAAVDMSAGPLGFVIAPLAASYAALAASHDKLPAADLVASESDLARIMQAMAAQGHFRDQVLKVVGEKTRRPVKMRLVDDRETGPADAGNILETKVEEIRLVRQGSSSTSYGLQIKTRVRLLRTPDRAVVSDQTFQYQSGTALFLDWTYPKAFQAVADTGYQLLAEHIVGQMLTATSETPAQVGVGYKSAPRSPMTSPLLQATRIPRLVSVTKPQFVSFSPPDSGQIGLYSTTARAPFVMQHPLTKDDAASEAMENLQYSMDELYNSRNSVVQLTACAVAVPLSLWYQTVGLIRGISTRSYDSSDAQLRLATQQAKPSQDLAYAVAQQLAPRTSQQVALNGMPLSKPAPGESQWIRCAVPAGPTESGMPKTRNSQSLGTEQDTTVEIEVLKNALTGDGGTNPSLSLCVEAQATVKRASDGAVLYSFPVHYRGEKRKFAKWAAHGAELFRQELQRSYQEMGNTIANRLVEGGSAAPAQAPRVTLAKN